MNLLQPVLLKDLANKYNLKLYGDANFLIKGISPINNADISDLVFVRDAKNIKLLNTTKVGAVILIKKHMDKCLFSGNRLVSDDPLISISDIMHDYNPFVREKISSDKSFISPDANISQGVSLGDNINIGGNVFIGKDTIIRDNVTILANTYIGEGCTIGNSSYLNANVTLYDRSSIGSNTVLHSGCVIGARGFGIVKHKGKWKDVPQLGGVIIGNDVEIGANSTIDCGMLEATVIDDGVKIDNIVHIGHNCKIGKHTAIAGCSVIGGSTTIGDNCLVGGSASVNGHIKIVSGTVVLGGSFVTKSVEKPDIISSVIPSMQNIRWKRFIAKLRTKYS